MKKYSFILLLSTITILISCTKETADNVNQDKIWTEYYLEYNEETGVTSARAIFKFSNALGTLLELTDSASVSFNGDLLTYSQLLGYYEKQYPILVTSGSFRYEDLDHHVFVNHITMTDSSKIPLIDTINISQPFVFTWVGEPIKAKERMNVWLNSNVEGDSRLFTSDMLHATDIIFPQNQLSQLGLGPYGMLLMERVYSPAITNATSAGGVISSKYIAKKRTGIMITN